ncbi:hypothetical protein [Oceanobacillus sp. MO10714A]|uniref:hypothetical protein n=2 Tax=unclassified Oceanobacillus TaxID=2630292 RepID=UPI00300E07C3
MTNEEQTKKPSEMNSDELPDGAAFEDEFTRGFLQSTEETRPGYYPFLSGTGKYEMDFPIGGIIGEIGYSKENERFESFIIGVDHSDFESSIDFKYMPDEKGNEQLILETLSTSIDKKLDFENLELEGRTLYFAPFKLENDDFGYVAYIQNATDTGGIHIFYQSDCIAEEAKCSRLREEENSNIIDWLKTIEFINESE